MKDFVQYRDIEREWEEGRRKSAVFQRPGFRCIVHGVVGLGKFWMISCWVR